MKLIVLALSSGSVYPASGGFSRPDGLKKLLLAG